MVQGHNIRALGKNLTHGLYKRLAKRGLKHLSAWNSLALLLKLRGWYWSEWSYEHSTMTEQVNECQTFSSSIAIRR